MTLRHIRLTDKNVRDHRFRTRCKYPNKLQPVFCGAEPTPDDRSRADARRLLASAQLRPDWIADLCPACIAQLEAK